ncbi:similar to Saccharomyces cerevisiae YGL060W YBP2 Central kinetochore associated protein that mediates mitotic progression [Maudiozyma barnettii]|uniref:Similar to Saccharomyces cerevisiae YGL060W YBP2 Central kinetochore associated protein that mediates mitotic progression n=1 Tax=Maudiozyma barnettii TaxID=61262 RepID=A0A8H2VIF6_9SACH|nr:Ybp2p [Kazachstania barnettii]CAB4255839.1 similar to Saccharomyces cerevisiae YGL060W YBP2 Central kinetochore associated protein that mediates mitotic progression [Kazachstania barnettii]CAD1784400.1 similar to Saccharomyces cerevisiae YGL060W YBP2 Central kinetochore associated protein that mediates mitotic progression [Kazachstania barnettii]
MTTEIEELCQKLTHAFEEQKDDPVSLVTVIDLYASHINSHMTLQEKESFLQTIHDGLSDHIIEQIGWDLPKTLLDFISAENLKTEDQLSKSPILLTVAKCFNKIAINGNSKECLLAACESLSDLKIAPGEEADEVLKSESHLLSDLKLDDSKENQNDTKTDVEKLNDSIYNADEPLKYEDETVPDIKIHFLFEMIITCSRRLETPYPSKFLAEVVMAISNFMRNNIKLMNEPIFFLKRVYQYIVSYNKIQHDRTTKFKDQNIGDDDPQAKIFKDELYLENKLISHLITHTLAQCLKETFFPFDFYYFMELEGTGILDKKIDLTDILSKFYLLTLLYDIDLVQEFKNYATESKNIYDRTFQKLNESEDKTVTKKFIDFLWKVAYNYTIEKSLKETTLVMDPLGVLILIGAYYLEEASCVITDLKITDAIYSYLRYTTTAKNSELYYNSSAECALKYCLWVTVTQNSTNSLREELHKLPEPISRIFLESFLRRIWVSQENHTYNISFIVLSRLLCLFPEYISFEFINSSLASCPDITARGTLLSILKVLMTKPIQNTDSYPIRSPTEPIIPIETSSNDKTTIDTPVEGQKDKNTPPKLPPRPYIQMNDTTMNKISITFVSTVEEYKQTKEDGYFLNLILDYMNFFVSLRGNCNLTVLTCISNAVDDVITDPQDPRPLVGFIRQANEILLLHTSSLKPEEI